MAPELPAELARHLVQLIKRTRRRYRRRLQECQEHFSETAVHELRVETRRALALLDLVLELEPAGSSKKARRALKKRLDAFDELRDTQVGLSLVAPWRKTFPEAAEFEQFLRRRERELVAGLRREVGSLKSRRVERMLKSLERDIEAARGKTSLPAAGVLRKPLGDAFAGVRALRCKIRRSDTGTIHRTRVAFKRFRYLCELLQPLVPGLTARRLREMHAWQTRMGDIQDLEVLLAEMERAVKHNDIRLQSVKGLHAALAQKLMRLVDRFVPMAKRLEKFRPVAARTRKRIAK